MVFVIFSGLDTSKNIVYRCSKVNNRLTKTIPVIKRIQPLFEESNLTTENNVYRK